MDDLAKLAYSKLARFQIALAVLIFASGVVARLLARLAGLEPVRRLLRRDHALFPARMIRALIARRMQAGPGAEREPRQKLILTFASHLHDRDLRRVRARPRTRLVVGADLRSCSSARR